MCILLRSIAFVASLFQRIGFSLFMLFASCAVLTAAEEARVFKNQDGVEIEASLVQVIEGTQIEIRRASDGQEFTIPISSLSLDDQAYVKGYIDQASTAEQEDFPMLTVVLDDVEDSIHKFRQPDKDNRSASSYTGVHRIRDRYNQYRVPVYEGAWIPLRLKGHDIHLPYQGEGKWEFSHQETEYGNSVEFSLQRDGDKKELTFVAGRGVTSLEKHLSSLTQDQMGSVLAIDCGTPEYLSAIENFSLDVSLSISLPVGIRISKSDGREIQTEVTLDDLARLQGKEVVGLELRIFSSDLEALNVLPDLKFLSIYINDNNNRNDYVFQYQPNLEHLVVNKGCSTIDWESSLQNLPALRSLTLSGTSSEDDVILSTFEDCPKLEYLYLACPLPRDFDSKILARVPALRHLSLNTFHPQAATSAFEDLVNINGLRTLQVTDRFLPSELLDNWFGSGAMSELRMLSGIYLPDFSNTPKLRHLTVYDEDISPDAEYERVSVIPDSLESLTLAQLSKEALERCTFPESNKIKSLCIDNSEIVDDMYFSVFGNLKFFDDQIYSTVAESYESLDLVHFPKLKDLVIRENRALTEIENISNHPTLESLTLLTLRSLVSLGIAYPNTTLKRVDLRRLEDLPNLSAISGLTGCEFLNVYDTAFPGAKEFLSRNPIERAMVYRCEGTADVMIPEEE